MNNNNFEQKVQKAQNKFKLIQQSINSTSRWSQQQQETTLTELANALEELQVSTEELQIQNEELLAARMEIEREQQRYQDLFEFAPDGYLVTDNRGIIQEVNSTAQKMLKVRKNLVVGKPLIVFVAEANRQFFHEQLNRLTRLNQLQDWEISWQPRKGDSFPALVSVSTIKNSQEKTMGWRWLIRDITERKQAEETAKRLEKEKELSEFKSKMLQTISYELCTPLNTISLSTQLLNVYQNELVPVKVEILFQKINAALSHLFCLSDNSLFFSRLELGKENWKPTTLEIEQYCKTIVVQVQSRATDEKIINFISHAHHSTIFIDKNFLQHILEILLENALKYSSKKSVINFELSNCDNAIVFRIQDSGIGIPIEDLPHIFELFYRAKNADNSPGLGLGLSIAKKAIDLCGGTISCESEVGVGTCFTVTLPLQGKGEINRI